MLFWPCLAAFPPIELSGTAQLTSVVHVKAGFGDRPMTTRPLLVNRGKGSAETTSMGMALDRNGKPVVLWL